MRTVEEMDFQECSFENKVVGILMGREQLFGGGDRENVWVF